MAMDTTLGADLVAMEVAAVKVSEVGWSVVAVLVPVVEVGVASTDHHQTSKGWIS